MTSTDIIRPEDRYTAETIAEFRSSGFWPDGSLAERLDHWVGVQPDQVAVSDGYGSLGLSRRHRRRPAPPGTHALYLAHPL